LRKKKVLGDRKPVQGKKARKGSSKNTVNTGVGGPKPVSPWETTQYIEKQNGEKKTEGGKKVR